MYGGGTLTSHERNFPARIAIPDKSGGIPAEHLRWWLEPWFPPKPPAHGTGLGVCRRASAHRRAWHATHAPEG